MFYVICRQLIPKANLIIHFNPWRNISIISFVCFGKGHALFSCLGFLCTGTTDASHAVLLVVLIQLLALDFLRDIHSGEADSQRVCYWLITKDIKKATGEHYTGQSRGVTHSFPALSSSLPRQPSVGSATTRQQDPTLFLTNVQCHAFPTSHSLPTFQIPFSDGCMGREIQWTQSLLGTPEFHIRLYEILPCFCF